MLVTQQPILRKCWHAVMPLSALADGSQPFTLLGESIVVFLDAVVDPRRRGMDYSMDSDRPGILIRRKRMALLTRYGESEAHG